jgi:hypothetical protein
MGKAILKLSSYKFMQIADAVDPDCDELLHVDSEGFSVNFGRVGSKGIRFEFF